jgi:hypothetical protein
MTDQQTPSTIDAALAALASMRQAASTYGRADLADRLAEKATSLGNPSFHVLVVGEFKQGKSSLLNALVSRPVCPVDDDIATAVPTVVKWSEGATAEVVFQPQERGGDEPPSPIREPISVEDVRHYAVEGAEDGRVVHSVEIGIPSRLLSGGLVLVDTPGVGGLGSTHGAVTAAAIPMAEAVIFVTDASQEFTAPELEFMKATRKLCPNIVCLVTKTDFYPAWRKIRDLNQAHLERMGVSAPIIPTSAALHEQAMAGGDANLLSESGYPELTKFIRKEILGSAVQLSVAAAASDLHDVLDQLSSQFAARKAVLEDPESAQERVRELEQAKARADELRSRAARWQVTLSDGVQDLNTDVEHDLRERFRTIAQEGDDALDNGDPADVWAEFEPWLYHRTAIEVVGNYELLQQRARELAERVAEHFETEAEGVGVDLQLSDPSAALGQVRTRATLDVEAAGVGGQVMMGLRGGMGGMMMFGMLSSVVGLALGPLGIGLGVVMGRRQLRDEKARMVTQRQAQAKAAQRKYLDEATFRTGKDSRDALRLIQRQIRDHFTARAEEQALSMQETLVAAQSAAKADQQDRAGQLAEVNAELDRLNVIRKQVEALGPSVIRLGSPDR